MDRLKWVLGGAFAAVFLLLAGLPAFAAGNQAGDIDQWANTTNKWQNGDLNPSNSHYREDYVVPYRAKLTGLTAGHSYTIPIEWDTTKGGLHSQDYLKTYSATEAVNPCDGGVCPAGSPTTFPIPIDSNVNNSNPPHPALTYLSSDPNFQFTMWGGAITGASGYVVSQGSWSGGAYSSDSSTSLLITFTASATSAVLAWGGHISTHSDWGIGMTAVNISGSAYHMRLGSAVNNNFKDNTDNSNSTLGNQDRSMKLAQDAFSSRVTVIKVGDTPEGPDPNTFFTFNMTQPQGAHCDPSFSLAANGSSEVCNLLNVNGSFTITETTTGPGNFKWGLASIVCTSIGAPAVTTFTLNQTLPVNAPNPGSVTFSINTAAQQDVTCTFTNKHKPTLTLTKLVNNQFGGSAGASAFTFHVTGTNVFDQSGNPLSSIDNLKSGTTVIMDGGGTFGVIEDSYYGYSQSASSGCSGSATFNDEKTCTITNSDIQPKLTVVKNVINNNGGTLGANAFTMNVSGTNVSLASFAGSEAGVTVGLNQGSFSVQETPVANYSALYVNCTGTILVGDHLTCTITNDDIGPKLKIIKNTIGGNGTFPISVTWSNGSWNQSIATSGGSGGDPYAQPPVLATPGTGDTGYIEAAVGSVTIAEDLSGLQAPPGWRFTSVTCQEDLQNPSPIAVTQGPSFTLGGLQLGHSYSCTFTNTQDALIPIVKKVNGNAVACDENTHVCTDPVSGQTLPTFTVAQFPQGSYPPSAPLASVTGPLFQSLSGAGSYTICETGLPTGWNLNDVSVLVTMFGGATGTLTPTATDVTTSNPATFNRCFDITIPAGADSVAITMNNKAEGTLKIVKETQGGDDAFSFGISGGPSSLGPVTINTSSGSGDSSMAALIGDYTITETGLPTGWALKSMVCTGPTGATVSTNLGASQITAKVVPGSTTTCTILNTKYGHLIVKKITQPATDTSTEFSILATGDNTINGSASRTLTGGSSTDYEVLAGTFSVAETNIPDGWDQTGNTCKDRTVAAGETVNCEITNTKRGHLIVQKTTKPENDSTEFTVDASPAATVTNGASGKVTDANDHDFEVKPGTYSVTETVPAGWDMDSNACTGIEVGPGETKYCEIVNTKRGHLIVQKTTKPSGDATEFTVDASPAATVTNGATGKVTDANDRDFEVKPGTYSVTETVPDGWDMNSNACTDVVVGAGETKYCEIVNTKRGHLIVQKTTKPSGDGTEFTVDASPAATVTNGASGKVTDATDRDFEVIPGTYSVTETVPTGWDMNSNACTGIEVGAGETKYCEIVNTKRGHLVVHKATNPANDLTKFDILASGNGTITNGGSGSISTDQPKDYEVTPGTYSVTETVAAGWDQTGTTCQGVVVNPGQTVDCTITNTMKGHLIVTKATNPSTDTTSQFPVTASGSGAITAPAARTLTGNGGSTDYEVAGNQTYSVTETVPSGWAQTGNTCQGLLVPPGQTVNCVITNNAYGHLVVTKTVVNDNGGAAGSSSFTMNVTGSGPIPASFPGNAAGTTVDLLAGGYSVSETGPSGYAGSYSADCAGTIAAGETKYCTVTNDDIQPKLLVTKVVVNDNGGTAFPGSFTINVNGSAASPSSFAGGSGIPVLLNAGAYSVGEIATAGYAASYSAECAGTIAVGEVKSCVITNNDIQPKLIVIKQVVNNNGGNKNPGDFMLNVNGSSASPSTFAGSAGTTVTLNAGVYSVSEINSLGYKATYSANCAGTIGIGETRTCVVTNNDVPTGLVTSSELCRFNVGGLDNFSLNYQKNNGANFTLNASNPGQFYYNVVNNTGSTQVITMTIPYPFVTSGATPVHVYTTWDWDDATQCFTPSGSGIGQNSQITMNNYGSGSFGSTTTVTVTVPAGAYANIHLDYGLKGTSPWQNVGGDAKKGSQTILNGQPYTFSNTLTGTQGATSTNKFN